MNENLSSQDGIEKQVNTTPPDITSSVVAEASPIAPVHVTSIWEEISVVHEEMSTDDSSNISDKRVKRQEGTPDYHQCFQGF